MQTCHTVTALAIALLALVTAPPTTTGTTVEYASQASSQQSSELATAVTIDVEAEYGITFQGIGQAMVRAAEHLKNGSSCTLFCVAGQHAVEMYVHTERARMISHLTICTQSDRCTLTRMVKL